MATIYNMTDVGNSDGVVGLFRLANHMTGDALILIIIIVLFAVSFISLKTVTSVKRSMAASSFFIMIITIFLRMTDIPANNSLIDKFVIITIVLFVFSAISLFFDSEETLG